VDQFDYVARARALMAKTVRTALVVVPLAAAASLQAGTIVTLPTGNPSCNFNDGGSGGACSGGASQINADPGDGVHGVSLYTTSPVSFSSNSGGSLSLEVSGQISGGGISIGTVIPLAYDFTITPSTSGDEIPFGWSLDFSIDPVVIVYGADTVSGSGSGTIDGTSSLTISTAIPSGAELSISADLSWSSTTGSGGFEISVPNGSSFDTNAVVPEPGSMGLLASALAWVGWRLRRRR
jgi:PEP-CTERM motif